MKRPTANQQARAQRKQRVQAIVTSAKASGEKVPRGVRKLCFDNLSPTAQAHAAKLSRRAPRRLQHQAA